ncbi:hypothetical protein P167DRAFT_579757 [Morchella conica CCBAS932]|uniref:Uncharacterized protein n=1 Tax=Morchella conica CCBAS932 TaxID=1392247 RepID=A0A3N4KC18_9PEZI|nr:hypothetical protein P167DRAFT_579757 [Morchella conica CCBAS932]
MIDPGDVTWIGKQGDVVCRPADWKDVLSFFLVNYSLHALTVITNPGSGVVITVCSCLTAILFPFRGFVIAVAYLSDLAISGGNSLEQAKLADALVMVVPRSMKFEAYTCDPSFSNIHGQHPFPVRTLPNPFRKAFWAARASRGNGGKSEDPEDSFNLRFNDTYRFAKVPQSFKVQPLIKGSKHEFELSSSYGIVKALAAVVQLAYGAYELYAARAKQFERFGYAAYSLTIIPYIIMSLVNFATSASRPSYPARYIVYYRGRDLPETLSTDMEETTIAATALMAREDGSLLSTDAKDQGHREDWMKEVESEVAGVVGYTYGDPQCSPDSTTTLQGLGKLGTLFIAVSLPYVLIYALTGFQKGESTVSQRSWALGALVWGFLALFVISNVVIQIGNIFERLFGFTSPFEMDHLVASLFLSAPTIGMFVTVARMILQDQICTKI